MSVSYPTLERQVRALLSGERDFVANAANFAALVYHELPHVNWAGFYLVQRSADLLLGPFCGRPACVRLPAGKGVCGTAVRARETVLVDDVAALAEHIACDTASRSELVVPLVEGGAAIGVFDVDSPRLARFSADDREGVEALVRAFIESTELPRALLER